MVRNYKKKKPEPSYTLTDIQNAVMDVQNNNKTYRQAEEYYGVPISVIYHRIKGRKVSLDRKGPGRSPALSQDVEINIVNCLIARSRMGYPCNKNELCSLVAEYVTENNIQTPFKNNYPGEDWYHEFMKRHPTISLKKPELLQKCRKTARDPYIVYDFYKKLKKVVDDTGLDGPELCCFIFNADETGFNSDPSKIRAIGEKGKTLSRISGGSGRENTTVLACVAADGSVLPPSILFKGCAVQARWVSEHVFPGTLYAASKNGWMEEPQFYNWFIKLFIPHITRIRESKNLPNQTALLLYDGHSSHVSVRIVDAAINNNIHLMRFPSHLTDRIQPLDKCVFGPLKIKWDKILIEWGKSQIGQTSGRLTKNKFGELLGRAWEQGMVTSNIKSGFITTGICPVDSNKFPEDFFDPVILKKYKSQNNEKPTNQVDNSKNETNGKHDVQNNIEVVDNTSNNLSDSPAGILEIFSRKLSTPQPSCSIAETVPKKVIPRLKQTNYGELLTVSEILEKLKEAEAKKKEKTKGVGNKKRSCIEIGKQFSKEAEAKKKDKTKGVGNKKRSCLGKRKRNQSSDEDDPKENPNIGDLVDDDTDDDMTLAEIVERENETEVEYETPVWENIKPNSFALVTFLGGPRKSVYYKYVCTVQSVDEADGDIVIQGLKVYEGKLFQFEVADKDVSTIKFDMITAILPTPEIKLMNRRLIYVFPGNIDVFEKH